MKTVPLYGKKAAGRVALVDDEDYDLVMQYRWYVYERTRNNRTHGPYAQAVIKRGGQQTAIKMHRLITDWPMIDHRDNNGLNNQRSNLRPTTAVRNQQNGRSCLNSTSKFKGVSWDRNRKRWQAQIKAGPRNVFLGRFSDEEVAARAYDEAALEAFGEHAHLNFPDASCGVGAA